MNYFRAHTVEEALATLADDPRRRVVCGGTDAFADLALVPARSEWVDISRIDALRRIERSDGWVRIGAASAWESVALTTWLPVALRDAAAAVGSLQIRVQGTVGGNLCHASPIADGVPPLLSLDAQVELASVRGVRRLPLHEFLLGARQVALKADELLVAILFPLPADADRTAFVKCTNRDGSALAVVSAAVRLRMSAVNTVEDAAVAVGGASAVALRMPALEASLLAQRPEALRDIIDGASLAALSPIEDCRATAAHRTHLARLAIMRALTHCIEEAAHGVSAG
ncbi:CO or xanthine dehydrogenase, FAD-binding subunit [Cupriavidus sp. OV038]|jgi:CO/xanthine dehydrogenase FAD-binding subunit|uniref:FAD binding domain-containing protein n=1 Tax=unclassified Cupriavidus TaxID=2640874 RepID=UPI0008E0FA04|nr:MULTISPECIES: FAD binding domain-containing protein [unclassified Cupriavidus]SFD04880.1 CO or xanthine dehydrogenase, FAD-binding subunit [Cupriavidus sp. OV038]SFP71138.1 CO or xanthine dehydrogenase, FAD-binding subunit [Cupriavidus sp. OV096]